MYRPTDISYYIISLGCSKNTVDSEKIHGHLSSIGLRKAREPGEASIIIINTCGFIEDAKKESIDEILNSFSLKEVTLSHKTAKNNSKQIEGYQFSRKIVVVGCLAQRYMKELLKEMPEIDFIYGIVDDEFTVSMCRHFRIDISGIDKKTYSKISLHPAPAYRYIKIAEGCSNNCSYCAIPLIRGKQVCFTPKQILKDINNAIEDGAREIILIAQDTASYRYGKNSIIDLVNRISEIRGVRWIRLLYCHPDHINDSFIEMIRFNEKVAKYIDLPFQHVSEKILLSMGRKGNSNIYLNLIEKFRKQVPDIRIRSTFMIGYPGEKDEDFQELLDFIIQARIDRVGCFMFSREECTAAFDLPGQVPEETKIERYNRLMEIQQQISREILSQAVGKTVDVIIESPLESNKYLGRSIYDAPEVDGFFYLTADQVSINSIVRARITDSFEYDWAGVMV